ncbi:M24 family metallopeptidase [Kangiella sp. HZ709]|nr:M24 family metallopeptidase [Kangiella sp. HZ709]
MQWMGDNSIAILPAANEKVRSRDVNFHFRQDSDFWYLTGFDEPEAVVVIIPGRKHGEFILFNREKDPIQETWHGVRLGQEGAIETLGADDAFPITDIDDILPGLMEGKDRIYFELGVNPEFDQQILEWRNQLTNAQHKGESRPGEMIDLKHHLHEMRLIKTQAEIQRMRYAANVSAKAHIALMKACASGKNERHMEAELEYHYALNDCRHAAYPSIVAAGNNANILHYVENDSELEDGDLLLTDAGCEFEYYASDISRTIPINGRFSKAQAELYDLVLAAQEAAIEMVKPGNHWNDIHDKAVEIITQGLIDLKILKGSLKVNLIKETYKEFYMHKTGHWLGLDVHDVGDYQVHGQPRLLEAGMVLTVEPGLYINKDNTRVAKKWRGIGIRIEDDVAVTKTGYDVLSKAAPKDREKIEQLMQ